MKHLAVACLALAACVAEPPPPAGEQVTSFVEQKVVPMFYNAKIDILFVIDSSPAMAAAQQKLIADYRAMMRTLSQSAIGELPDVHIGVTTADAVDQGRLRRASFLSDAPRFGWNRERNYGGRLDDGFVDLASVGATGHARVQPLDAVLRALSPSVNPGFVRDEAYIEIVILTAADDQSTTAVADVVHALKSFKTDPGKILVTGAFGACAKDGVTATEAPRLAAFLEQFPNRNAHTTLCEDLTPLVAISSQLLKYAIGEPCMEAKLARPFECSGWLADPTSRDTIPMFECSATNTDRCWEIRSELQNCPAGDHQSIHLKPFAVPFPATLLFECVADPD